MSSMFSKLYISLDSLKYPSLNMYILFIWSTNTNTQISNLYWFIKRGFSKYFYITN